MKRFRIDYEERTETGITSETIIREVENGEEITGTEIVAEFFTEHTGEILSMTFLTEWIEADNEEQMSMFDEKPYADGGLVAPEKTGLASGQTWVPVADYVDFKADPKLEEAVRMIDNNIWQSMIKDGIRGI